MAFRQVRKRYGRPPDRITESGKSFLPSYMIRFCVSTHSHSRACIKQQPCGNMGRAGCFSCCQPSRVVCMCHTGATFPLGRHRSVVILAHVNNRCVGWTRVVGCVGESWWVPPSVAAHWHGMHPAIPGSRHICFQCFWTPPSQRAQTAGPRCRGLRCRVIHVAAVRMLKAVCN